ncbi:MAG: hypothetical protein JXA96_07375 [Sedimentisphaerales bacterium]|nr:hypothetical protein [Sedimentisphaerales bacterium]
MTDYFLQLVLGQRNSDSEGIVQLLIFGFIIVMGVIRSLFAAKQEQNRKQNQKKPAHYSSLQRKPRASAEKMRMQRERVEQFLEGILQPKRMPPQQSSRPVPAKPQTTAAIPAPAKAIPVSNIYTNESSDSELYQEMSASVRKAETDTILDTNAIKIDNQLEQIQQLQEENIQEDQRHLIFHDKMSAKIPGKKLSGYIPSFSDSDDLRKAILYTEILGRPVSLRQSQALFD